MTNETRHPAKNALAVTNTIAQGDSNGRGRQPSASELLGTPGALLTRSHLAELGLPRRGVDSVFRQCPVIAIPGFSRPMIRAADYLALLESSTFRGDRVRA